MEPKQLIIEDGKPPQLVGTWRIGEIRAAAQFLLEWIDAQAISPAPPAEARPKNAISSDAPV